MSESDNAAVDISGATVSLTALVPFIRVLEEAGPEVLTRASERAEAVLARWGIALSELSEPTQRLPHDAVIALYETFVDVLCDPSAPLRAGFKLQPGDYELLEYLCASCGTLGESIACLGRYYPLLIAAEHDLWIDGERAEARFRIAPGLQAPDAIHEFALSSNFVMAAMHLQPEGVRLPLEICLAHAAPGHAAVFPQLFFAPVRFECEHNAIVFPVEMLDHPLRTANPQLHAVLTRLADQELAAIADQNPFPAKVREAIEGELVQGAPLEIVADRLGMSPSAVRSRLRQHGTSYSALLDRVRRERAQRGLRQSKLSVAELGHSLGFAHPPAFNRAFRRWFGVTPSAYREARSLHPASRLWRR